MKKGALFLSLFFFISIILHAAIPISEKVDQKKETIEKPTVVKKPGVLHRLFANNNPTDSDGLFNILSLVTSVLGTVALFLLPSMAYGSTFIIVPILFVAAIVLGIVGLSRKEKYKGMGIAGLSLSGGMILILALLVLFIAAIFSGC